MFLYTISAKIDIFFNLDLDIKIYVQKLKKCDFVIKYGVETVISELRQLINHYMNYLLPTYRDFASIFCKVEKA